MNLQNKPPPPHILSVHKDILTTEQIDGLDNNGSQVDKIYKVFNKKIDGTIGIYVLYYISYCLYR
jgi:hypothetical protein